MRSTQDRGELRRTPHGIAYPFQSWAVQIPVLAGAFVGGPILGWLVGKLLGGVSENAQIFLTVCFAGVFFAGYALWAARLASLVMGLFGGKALRVLLGLLLRRTSVRDLQQFLPDKDALEAFFVSAQKAAWSFLLAGVVIGLAGGALAVFIVSARGRVVQVLLVFLGVVLWGYVLGWLGRHGYLPMPEPQD